MPKKNNSEYAKAISERIKKIMVLSGLEIAGFAEFTSVSESHIYAIVNGTRDLTGDVADKIGIGFNLKGWQILKLNYQITSRIKKSKLLNNFIDENKTVPGYFIQTRNKRKDSNFIEFDLLNDDLFNDHVYVWEVRNACLSRDKKYTSKRISQILNYLVTKRKLKSEKRPIKLKNGGYGTRMVDTFVRLNPEKRSI
jgi:plasmid maintenance system antidote protein VapI